MPVSRPGGFPSGTRRLAALYALALVLRLAYAAWSRPPFDGDYWVMAGSLLRDGSLSIGGHVTTDFEPLYPVFLAACRIVVGASELRVQLLQIAMASLGVVLIYRMTATLTRNAGTAMLSAALYALDPLLIRQAVQHSEASLAGTLLLAFSVLFVEATTTSAAVWAGVVLGLAILTRAMIAPVVLGGAWLLVMRRRYRDALAFAVAALMVVAPFAARNAALNGSFFPTRGGVNLFVGNHPYAAALLPEYDVDTLAVFADDVMSEHASVQTDGPEYERLKDRTLTRSALAYMAAAPWRTAVQKLRNIWYLFSPRLVPYRTGGDAVISGGRITVEGSQARPRLEMALSEAFYSLLLILAVAGVYLNRGRLGTEAVLWCVVAVFVAVYAVYFPATRYRGPMSFVLMYYAAVALDGWEKRWRAARPL